MISRVIAVGLIGVVALVLLNAFFVAAEFALVAVDRTQVQTRAAGGDKSAQNASNLLGHLNFHLSGAQFGITLCSLGLGILAEPVIAPLFEPLLGRWMSGPRALGWSVAVALLVTTAVQMVVGELVPKSVAVSQPLRSVTLLATPIRWFTTAVGPVIRFCNGIAERLVRSVGVELQEEFDAVRNREELRYLVKSSHAEGSLRDHDAALLQRTFRFQEKTAAEALTPRTSVQWIAQTAVIPELLELSQRTGLSRFPVCRRDLDEVVGVISVKYVLSVAAEDRATFEVSRLMRKPLFVPETVRLPVLFAEMQTKAEGLAIVFDEYGGTAGVIALEDLIEEVVGEIDDEYDLPVVPSAVDRLGHTVVSGQLHPDEVREACGFEVPEGEFDTLAGFLLNQLGRIPSVGDSVAYDGWTLSVARMDRRRVDRVRVVPPSTQSGTTGAGSDSNPAGWGDDPQRGDRT